MSTIAAQTLPAPANRAGRGRRRCDRRAGPRADPGTTGRRSRTDTIQVGAQPVRASPSARAACGSPTPTAGRWCRSTRTRRRSRAGRCRSARRRSTSRSARDRCGSPPASAAAWSRVDPRTVRVQKTIVAGLEPTGIAVGEGAVWVADSVGDNVTPHRPAHEPQGREADQGRAWARRAWPSAAGAVWVANFRGNTVSRIDPNSNRVVATIRVGNGPADIAVGEGGLWVTERQRPDPGAASTRRRTGSSGDPVAARRRAGGPGGRRGLGVGRERERRRPCSGSTPTSRSSTATRSRSATHPVGGRGRRGGGLGDGRRGRTRSSASSPSGSLDTAAPDHRAAVAHLRRSDPVMASIIERVGPCMLGHPTDRGGPAPDHYGALVRSIVGQQLSVPAARSMLGAAARALRRAHADPARRSWPTIPRSCAPRPGCRAPRSRSCATSPSTSSPARWCSRSSTSCPTRRSRSGSCR